ncbi:hypothetical protein B0H12DRAFT_1097604 [Mycena haematopus]|nr:hypothetical protein B0H12DRAFT_1097604 [Mycena haematopus]
MLMRRSTSSAIPSKHRHGLLLFAGAIESVAERPFICDPRSKKKIRFLPGIYSTNTQDMQNKIGLNTGAVLRVPP